jgi:hypothetical protein
MIRVAVNGYGTIGKRVADAVAEQPDMAVAGVAKTRPNHEARSAVDRGYPLYAAIEERADRFDDAGIELAGLVDELVADADVVVDACPSGIGAENKSLYETYDTPALYQGGEDADFVDASFNARSNFSEVEGAHHVRRPLEERAGPHVHAEAEAPQLFAPAEHFHQRRGQGWRQIVDAEKTEILENVERRAPPRTAHPRDDDDV